MLRWFYTDFKEERKKVTIRWSNFRKWWSTCTCYTVINLAQSRWFNPFTAMLAALSLLKPRSLKVPNLKLLAFFLTLRISTGKYLYQNAQYSKQICYKTIKYTVCRRVCVHFSARKFYKLGQCMDYSYIVNTNLTNRGHRKHKRNVLM